MIRAENILIVGGTGRNSGKTSLATALISRFKDIKPIALKISPHFHLAETGLDLLLEDSTYNIFREKSLEGLKDSSRMLLAGASEAYYLQVADKDTGKAFSNFFELIDPAKPLICESPALRRYIEPGVFIIADSDSIKDKKNPGWTYAKADLIFKLGDNPDNLDIKFSDGRWSHT